jgi:glycosyltransferase involved in cell wall biosynthesis
MKIAFFTHRYPPDIGGVERSVEQVACALLRRGHAVTVITETRGAASAARHGGPLIEELAVTPRRPFTRLLYWRWMWRRRKALRAFDVLHFHDYGTFVHWYLPMRWVVRGPVYAMTYHGFDSWPIRWKDRVMRRVSSWCMSVTFGAGAYLREYYRHRIDEIYCGAPTPAPPEAPEAVAGDIVFIGRLAVDTAIDEVAQCLRDASRACDMACSLTLVGDGPLRARIVSSATESFTVHCEGARPDPSPYLRGARWIVATGLLAALDAFAAGIPVILPAFTPLKRAYFHSIPDVHELALLAHSPAELTSIFSSVLAHPDDPHVRDRVHKARRFAAGLSWDGIARQYLNAYGTRD